MNEKEKKTKTPTETTEDNPQGAVPGEYPEGKDQKAEAPLPHCRTAPDPEHQRAENEDEPCDDYRTGDVPTDDDG